MQNQTSKQSSATPSETRSLERVPRWDENWILLRRLFPDWTPTEEQVREVWFSSFDKPHGIIGHGKVNHTALRAAILAVSKANRWKEPKFIEVSDAYRAESNRMRAELDRASMEDRDARERAEIQSEHATRLEEISRWPVDRKAKAMQLVGKRMSTFANKSMNHATWSPFYTGCVYAADQEIRKEEE